MLQWWHSSLYIPGLQIYGIRLVKRQGIQCAEEVPHIAV